MYLDGGIEPASALVKRFVLMQMKTAGQTAADYKTALQELVQKKSGQTLTYHLVSESGPDHLKQFTVEARLNGELKGTGGGRSKKEAEQEAARDALGKLAP